MVAVGLWKSGRLESLSGNHANISEKQRPAMGAGSMRNGQRLAGIIFAFGWIHNAGRK
jgi:hypothetical protein